VAANEIIVKKNVARLSDGERSLLATLIQKGSSPARRLLKARILLRADVSEAGEGWSLRREAAQVVLRWVSVAAAILLYCFSPAPVEARPLRLLVLGDSLSSGFMLPEQDAFPYVLARRLHADGYGDVLVANGAIAGDTAADGLQRLPGALQYGADLVIIELGANDMLNGTDPRTTFDDIDNIIRNCKAERARVILAGMLSLPKFGPAYKAAFDAIYPTLAAKHTIPRSPFFLQGVFGHPRLMLSDGKHPNAAGVRKIVAGILPIVERNLMGARSRHSREVSSR
jgi:acyl-CoA thioesterase-1